MTRPRENFSRFPVETCFPLSLFHSNVFCKICTHRSPPEILVAQRSLTTRRSRERSLRATLLSSFGSTALLPFLDPVQCEITNLNRDSQHKCHFASFHVETLSNSLNFSKNFLISKLFFFRNAHFDCSNREMRKRENSSVCLS